MATRFKARFYVKSKTDEGYKNVEINWPEDKHRSTLYSEENQNRRVSRIISAQTGYAFESIRLDELWPLN